MISKSDLFCPRCRLNLVLAESDDVSLHGCSQCGGIWLNNEDSTQVVKSLTAKVKQMSVNAQKNAREKPDLTSDVQCPVCKYELERTWPITGIALDICKTHGTWFDAGELHDVVHRLRMDKAYGHINRRAHTSVGSTAPHTVDHSEDVVFRQGFSRLFGAAAADMDESWSPDQEVDASGAAFAVAFGVIGAMLSGED